MNDIYYTLIRFIHQDDELDRDTRRIALIIICIALGFLILHICFVGQFSVLLNIGILVLTIGSLFNFTAGAILVFSILLHFKDSVKLKARIKSILTQMISIPLVVLYLIFK